MPSVTTDDFPAARARPAASGRVRLSPAELARFANVNVAVNQNIAPLQAIEMNVLNDGGVIGAGFGPGLRLRPKQGLAAVF